MVPPAESRDELPLHMVSDDAEVQLRGFQLVGFAVRAQQPSVNTTRRRRRCSLQLLRLVLEVSSTSFSFGCPYNPSPKLRGATPGSAWVFHRTCGLRANEHVCERILSKFEPSWYLRAPSHTTSASRFAAAQLRLDRNDDESGRFSWRRYQRALTRRLKCASRRRDTMVSSR